MNVLTPIAKIMSTNLITVNPKTTLLEIQTIFQEYAIHHLPVVDNRQIVGIISKEDFLNFLCELMVEKDLEIKHNFQFHDWYAKDIMTTKLAKLDSNDTIRTAIEVFKLNRLHALPVVDRMRLVGLVTTHDLIKELANEKITLADYQIVKG